MDNNQADTTALPILISWYLTPLAILLVLLGVIAGDPDSVTGGLCIMIVLMSSLMNVASVILMKQSPAQVIKIRNLRVGLNYVANFFLLYLLLPLWPEIWLLILLMTIGTAIYSSFGGTFIHCLVFSAVLISISYFLGEMTGIKVWQTGMHCLVLLFIGPFINRLTALCKAG